MLIALDRQINFIGAGGLGGALVPDDVVNAVNISLGNTYWQQGISDAVFVRDWSAASPTDQLGQFLNGGTGEWDIPDRTVLITDTAAQSLESVMGRTLNLLGDCFLLPSVVGGSKGISMTGGVGTGPGIKGASGGALIIGSMTVASDDASREFLNLTNMSNLIADPELFAVANIGTLNATNITFANTQFALTSVAGVIGAACDSFKNQNCNYIDSGFLAVASDLFDMTTAPTSGERTLDFQNCSGNVRDANEAVVVIQADNGDNVGEFFSCVQSAAGSGTYIRAVADAAFNANPEKSSNFDFEVQRFVNTQRLGEVYVSAGVGQAPGVNNTYEDLASTFDDGGLSSGLMQVGTSDEMEWTLQTPANVKISVELKATDTAQAEWQIGAFHQPNGGGYTQIEKPAGTPVEDQQDITNNNPIASFVFQYTVRLDQGDRIKHQIERTAGAGTVTINTGSIIAEVI